MNLCLCAPALHSYSKTHSRRLHRKVLLGSSPSLVWVHCHFHVHTWHPKGISIMAAVNHLFTHRSFPHMVARSHASLRQTLILSRHSINTLFGEFIKTCSQKLKFWKVSISSSFSGAYSSGWTSNKRTGRVKKQEVHRFYLRNGTTLGCHFSVSEQAWQINVNHKVTGNKTQEPDRSNTLLEACGAERQKMMEEVTVRLGLSPHPSSCQVLQ